LGWLYGSPANVPVDEVPAVYTPYSESMLRLPALNNSRSPLPVRITLKRVLEGVAPYSVVLWAAQYSGARAQTSSTVGSSRLARNSLVITAPTGMITPDWFNRSSAACCVHT